MQKKNKKSIMARVPILSMLMICLSGLAYAFPEIGDLFILDRNAVAKGEGWRWFTSHFVHFSRTHLAFNLLTFGIGGWVVETKNPRHFGILCFIMAVAICASLTILAPGMRYYGGLSGLVCGVLFYGALIHVDEPAPWGAVSRVVILILPIKIATEFITHTSVLPYGEQQAFIMMPVSHLAGMTTSLLFHLMVKLSGKCRRHASNIHRLICRFEQD